MLALFSLSGLSADATLGYFANVADLTPGCFPQGMKLGTKLIEGIPMIYVIDREGMIVARGLRGENLVAAIQDLIDREE